ncbi:ATP-binding cassette domain-containing protein [Nocardia amamiensis]|uniref:ATP-binding cassette domain-containing protein n=2 Tax=Nocardia amamiensis TaxID=404578 RepID=A0ABS0CRM0_9NOCA|nr:ATP-binding cassette domain-containing protein [Nocardia amamiensis]
MWALLELSRWRVAVAIAWGVLALGSGLGLAALAAWLIARAWQMPPVLDLSIAVVAVRALGISRGLCRYMERLATHDVALRAMTTARTTVYRTLARSDFWLRRPEPSGSGAEEFGSGRATPPRRGDLLVRIGSDIDDLGAVVVRVFVPVAVAVVLSLAAVGLLATISVGAAAILAGALALSGVVAPWLSAAAAREAERAVRADRAEFTARALTVLDHAAELRVAGRLDAALDKAAGSARRAVDAEDTAASRSAWSAAATPLSIGASVLGALLIGIPLYGPDGGTTGAMTPMALTVLVLLPLSAFEAVGSLPAAAQALTTARAALHRIAAAAGGSPSAAPRPADPGQRQPKVPGTGNGAPVVAEPLSDTSPTDEAAYVATSAMTGSLDDADTTGVHGPRDAEHGAVDGSKPVVGSFATGARVPELPEGRRIAVVGPSGAGKTTLLMAWAGLLGTPRPGVTFFAEDAHLFGTSVLENLRVARGDLTEAETEKALRTVGLGAWLDGLPEGVRTDLVGGAAAVSGGQRRRILLARALVSSARVLLLDEPTEHLEAEAGARLLRALLDVDSGLVEPDRVVVVVTHQLPRDHRADTVLHIDASGQVTTDSAAKGRQRDAPGRQRLDASAHREIPLPTY